MIHKISICIFFSSNPWILNWIHLRIRIRIRIHLKCWIRIHWIRIHDTGFIKNDSFLDMSLSIFFIIVLCKLNFSFKNVLPYLQLHSLVDSMVDQSLHSITTKYVLDFYLFMSKITRFKIQIPPRIFPALWMSWKFCTRCNCGVGEKVEHTLSMFHRECGMI